MKKSHAISAVSTIIKIAIAILLSFAVGSIFILFAGGKPGAVYYQLLVAPLASLSSFGEVLTYLTPLMILGVGMAIARHAGLTNLGGEGQLYMGGLGAILVANSPITGAIGIGVIPIAFAAAVVFGMAWGGIAGFLKSRLGANEIITTLLLNYIGVNLIGWLVRGPIQVSTLSAPESEKIAESIRLMKIIPSSRAHVGIFVAFLFIVLYYIFIYRTKVGYNIRVLGGSTTAANYSGISAKKYYLIVMLISGAIAGFAGGMEVFGVQYKLTENMVGSFGFTGVVVALLGMLHPIGIIFAALLMSVLSTGAQYIQVICGVPVSLVYILQGLIVLFVLFGLSLDYTKILHRKKGGAVHA